MPQRCYLQMETNCNHTMCILAVQSSDNWPALLADNNFTAGTQL